MNKLFDDQAGQKRATIGPSITIKGEVSGAEDLLVEGMVEGTIALKDNAVIIGKSAKVKADVVANIVVVEGQVEGNLLGHSQVIVQKSGCVRGNITTPRLALEDGARLKGAINTESSADAPISQSIEKVQTAAAAVVEESSFRPQSARSSSVGGTREAR